MTDKVRNPAPGRCHAAVWERSGWPRQHQCQRRAVVDGQWCRTHAPEAEAARDEVRRATERGRSRRMALGWAGPGLVAALRRIEQGDNDPRATAREALEKISEYLENGE